MVNREEALRRIFEATGTGARLTDDQKRELLAHLDDAVEAKVDAGIPEMEAVGQAFAELGSLTKLRFPEASPALATAGGGLLRPWIDATSAMGYLLLLLFAFLQMIVTPSLVEAFLTVQAPLPGLAVVFRELSDLMRAYWPLVALALAGLAVLLVHVPRKGAWRPLLDFSMGVGGVALLGGVFAGVILPSVALLQGLALGR